MPDFEDKPYRLCAGIILANEDNHIFMGKRLDSQTLDSQNLNSNRPPLWQLPQGGIDAGESAVEAAKRELKEETGTAKACLIGEYPGWLYYDIPEGLRENLWQGRYRGQKQRWFCMRFTGQETDIQLDEGAHPEFSEWRWTELARIGEDIVPFKRHIYGELIRYFRAILFPS